MTPEFDITIRNRNNRDLFCTVTAPASSHKLPIVLLLHGFKGFRNWGFWPFAAQEISNAGAIVVRIDFALNGMRGTNDRVVSEEDFAVNNITHEVEDVHDVVDALLKQVSFESTREQWDNTIHIIGHSRGGAVTHVIGRELLDRTDVHLGRCVVWNTVGNAIRWTSRQREAWRKLGYMTVENTRTQQVLKLDSSFLDDLVQNAERFSLPVASSILGKRLLYIHADSDLTVNINEVKDLIKHSGTDARLEIIPGSTHTFGITHPVERITKSFVRVMELTLQHLFA